MNHTVSCVIPVHNGERFLAAALDSVLAQTHAVEEIIVVDDGSTDATPKLVGAFRGNIRYERQPQAGPTSARRRGMALASGTFIALLDADDLWLAQKVAAQLARFDAEPDLGYCTTLQQNFWVAELSEEAERLKDSKLAQPYPGTASTIMLRTALLERTGPLDVQLKNRDIQDWMLRARQLDVRSEVIATVLTHRRVHQNNLSRNRKKEEFFEMIKARRAADKDAT